MSKNNSKNKNDGKVAADLKLTKKEKKSSSLLSTILKKYPWPDEKDLKSNEEMKKAKTDNTEHDINEGNISTHHSIDERKVASTVECPECGKVFVSLDDDGCMIQNFGRCEDFIGETDSSDFSFKKGFDVLSDILDIYNDYIYGDTYKYISHLTGVNLKEKEDATYFLEELGFSFTNLCIAGNPDFFGGAGFLTVDRKLQGDLLKKLKVIKNRLIALEEADKMGELGTQTHDEIIDDLIDVYGTNIPANDLLAFIDCDPPPIGHLTTMLLINWLKRKGELSCTPRGFGPLNDYIFLKWLANGRQKEIMKSLKESITKDNEVVEVYEYLKKLSYQYANEKMPRFGGPYNGVPISRYKSNKELYSGFYVADSDKKDDNMKENTKD